MSICISCNEEFSILTAFNKCILCCESTQVKKTHLIRCTECDEEFDPTTPLKRKLGGKINQCCDCTEETAVKYAGVASGDGKGSQISVLSFSSEEDKKNYINFWQNTSGLHRGKSCQLSARATTDPGVKFKTISGVIATNHKGKST